MSPTRELVRALAAVLPEATAMRGDRLVAGGMVARLAQAGFLLVGISAVKDRADFVDPYHPHRPVVTTAPHESVGG